VLLLQAEYRRAGERDLVRIGEWRELARQSWVAAPAGSPQRAPERSPPGPGATVGWSSPIVKLSRRYSPQWLACV
jgi:hypothetical protein